MRPQIINYSLTEIVICFIVVGYAAVDLVPCDKTRRVFQSSWGIISDGPVGSNYTQDSHCEWLIKANDSKKYITLSFRSMGTECSFDYVFVYDGDSFNAPLLGSFSGKTEPQQVIATSGYMLVLLYSDTNYVLDGFRAEFSITDCPNNCSNHGVCYDHQCACETDWGGYDCSRQLCPDNCGRYQSRGHCDQSQCVCRSGFSGQSCNLNEHDSVGNKWHWLSHSEGGLQPRAAHSAVYMKLTDALYVFGGYNLNTVLGNLEVYNFQTSTWRDENGDLLPDKGLISSIEPSSIAKLIEHAGPDWEQKWGINSRTSFLKNLLYSISENATHIRRRQRHSRVTEEHKPLPRYGHSACALDKGFVLFGGKLQNGSLANDLWYYNVQTRIWQLRGRLSTLQPPPLTRHTLTCANNVIFLFGGSKENGEFSSTLYSIQLAPDLDENWEEIKPRGGKQLDIRVVAHSTVFHPSTNSLIVYGGIVPGVARFSKLSDRMFVFQLDYRYWTEIHYTREHLREKFVPRERAFHTANIFGNYLVIFGGYSHRHNKEEICYDNQMYLYHLGCHTWVNPDILGKTNESQYPKQQGVFAHASAVRNGNTLVLIGGYHGNVNGDLLAYTVPPMIATRTGEIYDPEAACVRHRNYGECSSDPECGWCSADEQCYGRTIGSNCTTNLQTTRCPGVCPALGDCHSCLIHGHILPQHTPMISAARKLGLEECTWCVQNARCHHKDDNYGVCGLQEDSPSQIPGWWGPKGTEVVKPEQCRELDRRPGLTFVKYHYPVNYSQPDNVAIINATTVDFISPTSSLPRGDFSSGGEMVARLLGFLRLPPSWQEMLNVCVSFCSATLTVSDTLVANVTPEAKECMGVKWPDNITLDRISVDFMSKKMINMGYNTYMQQSKMELQHFKESDDTPKVSTGRQDNNMLSVIKPQEQCKTCSMHVNCSTCLSSLSCGWCYNNSNPMSGVCVQGDFNNPHVNCSLALGSAESKWAYAQCPDVDECGLGLHDCHEQAICTNTDGSFSCHCKKGYIGDGRKNCHRTCFNVCIHGVCQGEPDYSCKCDIGWYGDDCSKNCGCNNHSACPQGEGICEECVDNTMGDFCEYCRPGSYGNATTELGCKKCDCNGHGNKDQGECDIDTGICFCEDNTEGDHCERCKINYFGDPKNGNQCYYQCEARGLLRDPQGQGITSMQSYIPPWGGTPARECLWIIKPYINSGSAIIQLEVKSSQLNVSCGENAVYVYDGLPELVDMGSQSALSAVFCTEEALPINVVESRTGQLTVHYKQGLSGESFSAMYKVMSCDNCLPPRECRNGQCVCQDGLVGFGCEEAICPKNCSHDIGRGSCDKSYGRCLCTEGWTGPSCETKQTKTQLIFTELFNTVSLADSLEHLRKTLPRFGHSLVSDRRGALWMFGGYSLSHGPLNDIRQFDTKNLTWMQVTVESTPDARMPMGRYFHGSDIVHTQTIYVYGGLTKKVKNFNNRTLDDFWQFDIQNQRWNEIEKGDLWPPAVAGHTLTYHKSQDCLLLIGGVSPQSGFLNFVWEYRLEKKQWQPMNTKGKGPPGIFGHTTVYHAQSNNVYVFGGVLFEKQLATVSNNLFMFNYDNKTWTKLNSLDGADHWPRPRYFHSAVTTDDYMMLFGGRMYPWNITDTLYVYSYNCNKWMNLMSDAVEKVGPPPTQTYAQAMTVEPDGDAIYTIGGWGIDTQSTVLRMELPADLCNLLPKKFNCLHMAGCGYCANGIAGDVVSEQCHTNTKECSLETLTNASLITNQGEICTMYNFQTSANNCSISQDCTSCLQNNCYWCQEKCISNNSTCMTLEKCPYNQCVATDCIQCNQIPGCDWNFSNRQCVSETQKEKDESLLNISITYEWHYVKCPPENECNNGHHSCVEESEICVDLEEGFECRCGPGYKAGLNGCEPICSLGCVRGQCVQPNKCLCDFGYVGANCSIQCQCNGHANCEGPDKLDKCLSCHNNTMGEQCEKCKPLFVGDPADGGLCVPCVEYCHGHSSFCVDNSTDLDPDDYIDYEYLNENLKEGPKANARCLRCANLTSGPRCDECIIGNFRGSEDHKDPCRPCDCHGHGDTCDPIHGDKCNCQNNTESDVCRGVADKNSAHPCWMVQCSKCKDGYLGTPTSGHQCYKQMHVDNKMCFDAKPMDECKMKPKPLHPGDVVFFVIQPRFMNVDIRIIIDVTQGKLNVFMSTHDDTYIAYPNSTTGLIDIDVDGQYGHWENGSLKAKDSYFEKYAMGLRTYITITQPKTILLVKHLQDRLVITLPEEYHSLETTRFFLVLQALEPTDTDKKVSYGIVFSRQDQLHIDLFVFFSVFFSCFFLFLAACVVAWKAKQAADVRRARRRHVVEMLHMAKRPFASVTLNLSCRPKPKKSAHYDLRPVAVEPTGDGIAAVATVFVSLPGGQSTSVKLALASSLILLARQFPTGGRIFLRRRSIHAAPPI
nr:multiple epidermal growth factor-like domains protein 8 [Leptinotarsa decemlineata]